MSHINRPQWPAPQLQSLNLALAMSRQAPFATNMPFVSHHTTEYEQDLMRGPFDAQHGAQRAPFLSHANMPLSLVNYSLAPPGTATNSTSPDNRTAGSVAFNSYRGATTTTIPYQPPLKTVPHTLQAWQFNAAMPPATQHSYVPSQRDYWAEAMSAMGGFGPQTVPHASPTSYLAPETFAPIPIAKTYNEFALPDAPLTQDDWSEQLFAPHALEMQALPTFNAHAPMATQSFNQNPEAQADDWSNALFDVSGEPQYVPDFAEAAPGGQHMVEPDWMNVDAAMMEPFAQLQQVDDLFLNNLLEIPTWPSPASSGALNAHDKPPEQAVVGKPDASSLAELVPKDAQAPARRPAPGTRVDPQTGQYVAKETPGAITLKAYEDRQLVNPKTGEPVPLGTEGAVTRSVYRHRKPVDPETGKAVLVGTPGAVPRRIFDSHRLVDPQTGTPVPAGTAGAVKRMIYHDSRPVDPQTGKRVPLGTQGAITQRLFYRRQYMDPRTGQSVPAGTPGAISRNDFYARKTVDPHTGEYVALGTPNAVSKNAYEKRKAKLISGDSRNSRRYVDPKTGEYVASETPGAISKSSFDMRQFVDPQTGKVVPQGTPNAVTKNAFYARTLVNPQTGAPVAPGTPGAITKSSFYNLKPVDPRTGESVPVGTPGAIAKSVYNYRRLVDPQTGEAVAEGTPGAIAQGTFYARSLVDPQTGRPVAAGTPGAITRRQFRAKKRKRDD